jgi:hypothetical protein
MMGNCARLYSVLTTKGHAARFFVPKHSTKHHALAGTSSGRSGVPKGPRGAPAMVIG